MLHAHAHLTCKLAINVYLDAGIIQRLLELQVAKGRNFGEFGTKLFSISTIILKTWSRDRYFDGSGSAKVHDLAHDVARSEREVRSRKFCGESLAQTFFELAERYSRAGPERDSQHGILRTASPEENRIDRIGRRLRPHVAQRNCDLIGARSLLNFVQDLQRHDFSSSHAGAGRRAETELELSCIHGGEYFSAQ